MHKTLPVVEGTTTTTTQGKTTTSDDQFYVHFTHEQRLRTLKKDMHQVYDNVFQNTPAMYSRMIVGTRNRRDMKNELIRKRPKRTLLKNRINKSTYHVITTTVFNHLSTSKWIFFFFYFIGQQKKINKHSTAQHPTSNATTTTNNSHISS